MTLLDIILKLQESILQILVGLYQKGILNSKGNIELRTEEGNDTTKAEYEPIGNQAGEDKVVDNGIMFFNSSSYNEELSFLNDTIAVYKDMIVAGFGITTIASQRK